MPKTPREKPKSTPEERKQAKLLKKEKKAALKKEKELNARRAELFREKEYGKLNLQFLDRKWKDILSKIKNEELSQDLIATTQIFEKLLDAKDYTISFLKDELKLNIDVQLLSLRGHIANMDKLINVYHDLLNDIALDLNKYGEKRKQQELEYLSKNYNSLEDLKTTLGLVLEHRKNMDFLNCTRYITMQNELESMKEDTKNYMDNWRHKYFKLFRKSKNFVIEYQEQLEALNKKFGTLPTQEAATREDTQKLARVLVQKKRSIDKLKYKFKHAKKTLNIGVLKLENDVDYLKQYHTGFCFFMRQTEKIINRHTDHLVTYSYNMIDWLEQKLHKGENVLRLIATCSRLETEKEKVLAFPFVQPCDAHASDSLALSANRSYSSTVKFKEETQNFNLFSCFYKKMAMVSTDIFELDKERAYLKDANEVFTKYIQQYCSCFQIQNPVEKMNDKPTVVCAKQAQKNYEKHKKRR